MKSFFAYITEFYGIEEDLPKLIREKLLISMRISILEFIISFSILFLICRYLDEPIPNSLFISGVFSFILLMSSRFFNLGAIHNPIGVSFFLFFGIFKAIVLSIGTMVLVLQVKINENKYERYLYEKDRFEYVTGKIYNVNFKNESLIDSINELNNVVFGIEGNIFYQFLYAIVFTFFFGLTLFPFVLTYDRNKILTNFKELRNDNINRQLEIFSSIQHELGNKLPATKQEIKFLLEIFEKKGATDKGLKISDKVREPLPGEELYSIDSVKDLFVRSLNKLDYSLNVVSQLGDVLKADPTKLRLEPLDLVEFLEIEVPKYSTSDNRVSIEIIGEKNIFVEIDRTQFGFLLNNLISNAIRHGITEKFPELKIKFIVQSDGKFIHLIVINNGCPMDSSITFEKFTTPFFHFGRTGNSGLGGYIINTIVKNHNASFTLNSTLNGSDSFKTVFDFKFKESSKK